ncbi:MAG: hypothetical protein ACJ8EK_06215 [Bradyrhizobium sp.]
MTLLLLLAAVVNPLGLDMIHAAFFSGEALSRNIWQPIALVAFAMLLIMIALEWFIRLRALRLASTLSQKGEGSKRTSE